MANQHERLKAIKMIYLSIYLTSDSSLISACKTKMPVNAMSVQKVTALSLTVETLMILKV